MDHHEPSGDEPLPPPDALGLVTEQRNKLLSRDQQRLQNVTNILAAISAPGREMALGELPDLLERSGLTQPVSARQYLHELEETKKAASVGAISADAITQAAQLSERLYINRKEVEKLQANPNELGAATTKGRMLGLQAQVDADTNAYNQLLGEDSYIRSQIKHDHLADQFDPIVSLNSNLLGGYLSQTIVEVAVDRAQFVEGLDSEELKDELFTHALQVIQPKLLTLVRLGRLTGEQAAEYIQLIKLQHTEKTPPNVKLAQLVEKTPGLEVVHQAVTGVESGAYKAIFELLAQQETQPFIDQIKQATHQLETPAIHTQWLGYHVDDAAEKASMGSDYALLRSLSPEARFAWEVVRSSTIAQAFPPETWRALEERIVPELYRQTHLWSFNPKRFDTPAQYLAMSQARPDLRREVLPGFINGLTHHYLDNEVAVPIYELLASLTAEDLASLEERGFGSVARLRDLVESNPTIFDKPFLPDPEEPWNYQKNTRNPVYPQVKYAVGQLALHILEQNPDDRHDHDQAMRNLNSSWIWVHHGHGENEAPWQDPNEHFSQETSDWMLYYLRDQDRMLRHVDWQRRLPTPETKEHFLQALNTLQTVIHQPETSPEKKAFLLSEDVLTLVARQPHKVEQVIGIILHNEHFDRLAELMAPDGPLSVGIDGTLHEIFSSGNPQEVIQQILESFNNTKPYWEFLFDTCKRLYGEDIRSMKSGYPITEVPTREGMIGVATEDMVEDQAVLKQLAEGKATAIPIEAFHGMYKEAIFREYLRRAVVLSRDSEAKQQADQRNRATVRQTLTPGGLYLHGTAIDVMDPILLNGNLPKQIIGTTAITGKNFPFHTDFIRFDQPQGGSQTLKEMILGSRINIYGGLDERTIGQLGESGQIFFVYDRNQPTAYEGDKDFEPQGGWENHRIILGGMPSTEISAVILREPAATFAKAVNAISENGFYIPIYDLEGNLLLTPQQFDDYKQVWNSEVAVPVWDYSFKVGGARGSHQPAGEYVLPSREDSTKKYYVKFAKFDFDPADPAALAKEQDERSRIWNEFLAEKIYHQLGVPIPHTGIVKVNRTYGHAAEEAIADARSFAHTSEMLDVEAETGLEVIHQRLKNGFIADAFLGNWDIVKPGNVVASGGEVYRIDNGGALLFRANEGRKQAEEFNGVVTELVSMRGSYPNLTDQDIQAQLAVLKEKLQDADIDTLVDSVRLKQNDRDFLRTTLRQRRDYILGYFNLS